MHKRLLTIRRLVQAAFLFLFFLFIVRPAAGKLGHFLFQGDIWTVGSAAVSSRAWFFAIILSLTLLALTVYSGRLFCGWACPLGAMIDGVDFFTGFRVRYRKWRIGKYHLLIFLLCLSAGGLTVAWLIDPLNWAAHLVGFISPGGNFNYFWFIFLSLLMAALIIVLGRRGFCRVGCPLGALLGGLSSFSFYKFNIGDTCTSCGTCVKNCRMAAFENRPEDHNRMECVHCRDCEMNCPTGAISFKYLGALAPARPDPLRRSFLFSLVGGAVLSLGLRTQRGSFSTHESILRPPGVVPEDELRNLCIRCGSCVRICPTRGLVPDAGREGYLWYQTPVLSGREGGCAYNCHACGQVCPTGAIRPLPLEEKQELQIGRAAIDPKVCVAFEHRQPCVVCYSSCPAEAISLVESDITLPWGEKLYQPRIMVNKCIGCALCETACPVAGAGAIITFPRAEQVQITE